VPIDKAILTLGRRSETDIRIPGAGVSRVHAEVVAQNGVYRLRDRESRFGTFVNGDLYDFGGLLMQRGILKAKTG
jgi:pSer/pThr/pTyr-binding forkhead associated (FHA) protein